MDVYQWISSVTDISAAAAVIVITTKFLKHLGSQRESFLKIVGNHMQHETEASERLTVAVEKLSTLVGMLVTKDLGCPPESQAQKE